MNRVLSVLILLFLPVLPVRAAETGPAYLSNIPDIPVISGGMELSGDGFIFDSPDGRVVESIVFLSENPQKNVRTLLEEYYKTVLPQLGWVAQKSGVFVREREQLTVKIEKFQDGYIAVFDLSPESD